MFINIQDPLFFFINFKKYKFPLAKTSFFSYNLSKGSFCKT